MRIGHQVYRRGFELSLLSAIALSLAGYGGRFHPYLELTCHFKLQYCVVGCAGLIFFSYRRQIRRQKGWVALSLGCIALNLWVIIPWYIPLPKPSTPLSHPLRVLLSNVNVKNQNTDAVVALIQSQHPDLVVVIETNDRWLNALAAINFPYRVQSPQAQQFSIAMYSKFPLQVQTIETFDGAEDFHLAATLQIDGDLIEAIALHPPPPKNQKLVTQRNRELEAISRHIKTLKHPVVVAGDFNTSLWSPYYQQFSQQSHLQDTRQGFGILPTWPTWIPFLYIPIDHGLVSSEMQVIQTQTGSYVGSDHLPLILDLAY